MIQNSYKYGWLVIVLCFLGVSCASEKTLLERGTA